jgi:hypothetical protein
MSAIAVPRPSGTSVWARIFRTGPGRLAALVDGVLTGGDRPPPPPARDDQLLEDPETQMMIALTCAMQI